MAAEETGGLSPCPGNATGRFSPCMWGVSSQPAEEPFPQGVVPSPRPGSLAAANRPGPERAAPSPREEEACPGTVGEGV